MPGKQYSTQIPVEVPAPTMAQVKAWFADNGWEPVHFDEEGTIWSHVGGTRLRLGMGDVIDGMNAAGLLVELSNTHARPPAAIWAAMTGGAVEIR